MAENNDKKAGKENPIKRSSDILDASRAKTQPLSSGPLPDANVDAEGHCIQPAYAEDARPDTGAPCLDGRDGR